jgi:NNP family nitrate/nitrite transporter-like MFS transporter
MDLGLSKADIGNANIASLASFTIFRFVAGPLCNRYGARRVFAIMFCMASIPAFFAGFIKDATGLIVVRACIGTIGAVFVP